MGWTHKHKVHKSCGLHTGLGICAVFSMLFRLNEVSPRKLTDKEIEKRIKAEFPDRPSSIIQKRDSTIRTVNKYRHEYNKGFFNKGVPPKVKSFRYNEHGQKVEGKYGRQVLESI